MSSDPKPFDGVYKMGGVCATGDAGTWISVRETSAGIQVLSPVNVNFNRTPSRTVAEARSLAAQIMELARRHEVRKASK